jgi:hypothetical protein
MVEVFKTNVQHPDHAKMLIDEIHATFRNYTANFDLEDCDRILRVKCSRNFVEAFALLELLKKYGFDGEVLSDDKPVDEILQF